jgi:hypothetical protein
MKRQESCEEEERDDKHVQNVVLGTNTNMGFQFGHLSLWIKLMELPCINYDVVRRTHLCKIPWTSSNLPKKCLGY